MGKRVINISLLPGEPQDASGRVCIHFFVRDERGPITEPCVPHNIIKDGEVSKELEVKATKGRLACDQQRTVALVTRKGITTVTHRTEGLSAVTCPKCLASVEYAEAIEQLTPAETSAE